MKDQRLQALEFNNIGPLLLKYAAPAVVGTMVTALYNIVDRIFIGQGVGSQALAGLAITFPVLIFMQAFGMLVGAGASVKISILLGQKESLRAESVLANAVFLTFFFNTLFCSLGYIYMKPLLLLFGATPEILPEAQEYLSIVLGFNVLADLAFSYNAIIRTTGYPAKAMITMLIGAVLNCLLDPLFIFVFKWGIAGAAWATVISEFVCMCFVMSHFFMKSSVMRFRKMAFRFSWPIIRSIIAIGVAPFAMMLVASVINITINRSFGRFGTSPKEINDAIATYGIIISIVQLFIQFMVGVSQGAQPIMSYNFGAGKILRSIKAFKLSLIVNLSVAVVGFLIALLLPDLFIKPFKPDAGLERLTRTAIGLVFLAFPLVSVQVSTVQFFQSLGYAKISMFISLSRQVVYLLPGLLLIPRIADLGIKGVWYAMPISDALSGLTALLIALIMIPRFIKKYPTRPDGTEAEEITLT